MLVAGEGVGVRGLLIVHDVLLPCRNKLPDQRHLFSHHAEESRLAVFSGAELALPFDARMKLRITGFDIGVRRHVPFFPRVR